MYIDYYYYNLYRINIDLKNFKCLDDNRYCTNNCKMMKLK